MRSILLLALLPVCLVAAPALGIVKPVIAQSDGGDAVPAGFTHTAGETMFFSCNIAGFTKSADEQIHMTYTVQAFDPKGVPVAEVYKNELQEEVGPQDKDWQPKIETEIVMPDILLAGTYKIVIKAEDLLAKTSADLTVPFQVAGLNVTPSATLVVSNFRWYHHEDDQRAMSQPIYHAGDDMYIKFDITGFKYGEHNKVDTSYVVSLVLENGKTIWASDPAAEQSDSFYPKPYITGEGGINLQKDFKPGTYNMAITAKDAMGKQNFEKKFQFIVQ